MGVVLESDGIGNLFDRVRPVEEPSGQTKSLPGKPAGRGTLVGRLKMTLKLPETHSAELREPSGMVPRLVGETPKITEPLGRIGRLTEHHGISRSAAAPSNA